MNLVFRTLSTSLLCAATVAVGALTTCRAYPSGGGPAAADAWERTWKAVRAAPPPDPIPAAARQAGPPVREGDRVLFRFRAPSDSTAVYLAGSFNAWARNDGGKISDKRFAMYPAGNGVWYQWVTLSPQTYQYKFVTAGKDGNFRWVSDPSMTATDADGNTVLDVSALDTIVPPPPVDGAGLRGRALKPFPRRSEPVVPRLETVTEKVWTRPDQKNTLLVTTGKALVPPGTRLHVRVETPLGETVYVASQAARAGLNRVPLPPMKREGGFLARATLVRSGRAAAAGETVLSAVKNVADDLRYGFYATYAGTGGDYAAKAASLARLHVNAVEFYDYFPAHGYYAPREEEYRFEPFGTPINALDIRRKIDAGHRRNILSLAYVAAYAASESVYRQHPYPMTNEKGVPKIFNGGIMAEDEADRQKKAKWFWIMNVADDSLWYRYIMGEFARTLDDKPGDLVSFDGFEIDTYGDSADSRFYAAGSKRSGDPLRDVLRDFVGDVRSLTRRVKPHGLVSFNSVNEFAVENMYDVTDFLFLEIWKGHTERLEDLVDICFRHRAPRGQRVILKVYPADMAAGRTAWPEASLRRVLAAAMTGAGSLMVVGEPDEKKGAMHGLNTLYYPDHTALPSPNEAILQAYYAHDALLLGYTHGRGVVNTPFRPALAGCITRTYAAPERRALVIQLLHTGAEKRWSVDPAPAAPRVNQEVVIDLPGGVAPRSVHFVSPDVPALRAPVKLDFQASGGKLRLVVPELRVHGTLLLHY